MSAIPLASTHYFGSVQGRHDDPRDRIYCIARAWNNFVRGLSGYWKDYRRYDARCRNAEPYCRGSCDCCHG